MSAGSTQNSAISAGVGSRPRVERMPEAHAAEQTAAAAARAKARQARRKPGLMIRAYQASRG